MSELNDALEDIAAAMALREDRGEVATYIPELAAVDPGRFGIAVVTNDDVVAVAGDAEEAFSIQSVSKVFTLAMALGRAGDALWKRIGREPSGDPFNSIVQLERKGGIPRNPFINAGALVVSDVLLAGHRHREAIGDIVSFMRFLADDDTIVVDRDVAMSEQRTGFRNVALGNYLRAFDNLRHAPELTLGVYFHHCAIAMSCRQLALAGRFLARGGRHVTGHSVVSARRARRINALMLTCGHYDGSGEFAFRVGIPGKSGVGGGILGIVPGIASVAVWSPGLDAQGNSRLGTLALEMLVERMDWSVFARSQ